jgi:site-specific DNA-cytosine methylase
MRIGYLCAGIGCNILADLANGHEPVFACDIEPYPCAVLRERAPVWFPGLEVIEGDLRSYDFASFQGRVDCLSFGFPCQDLSGIGSGLGLDGARSGIAFDCLRILGLLRCEYAFIENVSDLIDGGLDRLLCELAAMGYDARWATLSAAATGASHGRDRVWILAHAMQERPEGQRTGGAAARPTVGGRADVQMLADAVEIGRGGSRRHGYMIKGHSGTTLTDACQIHLGVTTRAAGDRQPALVLPNPEFAEWLMRLPGGWSRIGSPPSEMDKTCSPAPLRGAYSEVRDADSDK